MEVERAGFRCHGRDHPLMGAQVEHPGAISQAMSPQQVDCTHVRILIVPATGERIGQRNAKVESTVSMPDDPPAKPRNRQSVAEHAKA